MDELERDRAKWKGEIVLSWKGVGLAVIGTLSLVALGLMTI